MSTTQRGTGERIKRPISSQGQVTLPKSMRDESVEEYVVEDRPDGRIVLTPVEG